MMSFFAVQAFSLQIGLYFSRENGGNERMNKVIYFGYGPVTFTFNKIFVIREDKNEQCCNVIVSVFITTGWPGESRTASKSKKMKICKK